MIKEILLNIKFLAPCTQCFIESYHSETAEVTLKDNYDTAYDKYGNPLFQRYKDTDVVIKGLFKYNQLTNEEIDNIISQLQKLKR